MTCHHADAELTVDMTPVVEACVAFANSMKKPSSSLDSLLLISCYE